MISQAPLREISVVSSTTAAKATATPTTTMTYVPSDGIYPVMGLHPHVVGGISLIVTVRFIPYPAFPPYDVKKLHPGLRPTSATQLRICYTLQC